MRDLYPHRNCDHHSPPEMEYKDCAMSKEQEWRQGGDWIKKIYKLLILIDLFFTRNVIQGINRKFFTIFREDYDISGKLLLRPGDAQFFHLGLKGCRF